MLHQATAPAASSLYMMSDLAVVTEEQAYLWDLQGYLVVPGPVPRFTAVPGHVCVHHCSGDWPCMSTLRA